MTAMTTDEFAGHLLAALHGPHAVDIAARVVEVYAVALTEVAQDPENGKAAVEFVGIITRTLDKALGTAALREAMMPTVMAILSDAHVERLTNPRDRMRARAQHHAAIDALREFAREHFPTHVDGITEERMADLRAAFEDKPPFGAAPARSPSRPSGTVTAGRSRTPRLPRAPGTTGSAAARSMSARRSRMEPARRDRPHPADDHACLFPETSPQREQRRGTRTMRLTVRVGHEGL